MKGKKRISIVFTLLFILLAVSVFSSDIDMSGRDVLLSLDTKKDNQYIQIINAGTTTQYNITFSIDRSFDISETLYALHLGGIDVLDTPNISLNDTHIDFSPVKRPDGMIIRIPHGIMRYGINSLSISINKDSITYIENMILFSLRDTFEEVHFEWAFSDPVILVQPPKHPTQNAYDAQHYDLDISINMSSRNLSAVLTMDALITQNNVTQIAFDFDPNGGQMIVSKVDTGDATPNLTFATDDTNDWLIVNLPAPLNINDTIHLRVFYAGRPSTGGVFGSSYRVETHGSSIPIVYTFSQPYGGRKWWPSKDIPEDKATIDIHVTADDPYFVVSNGSLISIQDVGNGKRRFNYSESYPIVTYLVSICCTNYIFGSAVYTSQDGTTTMTVGHYVYPENSAELGGVVGTMEAMNFFAQKFAEYPFLSEKYVTATHNSGAGMEHQTCTSMPPRDLLPDGRGRRNIHELAHMWFGDSITMTHYDHLWLNEGWATYAEALYVEQFQGMEAYHAYVDGWNTTGINDTTPLVNPNADLFYGSLVYRKGAWVLHMLRHVVGDQDFLTATRNYYNKYKYSTALTDDLRAEYEALYGSSLEWFFNEWVFGTGRPTYYWAWDWNSTRGGNEIELTITQMQSGDAFIMPVDVRVVDPNGQSVTFSVFNNQKFQTFTLDIGDIVPYDVMVDPDKWILHNTGYASPVPTLLCVLALNENDSVQIEWSCLGDNMQGFQILTSTDLDTWELQADQEILPIGTTSYILDSIIPDTTYYIKIRSISFMGLPSALSDVYGVRLDSSGQGRLLIVDGNDQWDTQGYGTSHPWAAWHGKAINSYGYAFDTCANELIEMGSISLSQYAAITWCLGEESRTPYETFSSLEQDLIKSYLKNGGRLFVSGSEVGWDLDYYGSTSDKDFYNNFFKSSFINNNSDDYSVVGTRDNILAGISFSFDNGTAGIYPVYYPDVITTANGSLPCLDYDASNIAGVQFAGLFPEGVEEGRIVYFAFPFETIYPETSRNTVMAHVLQFLFADLTPTPIAHYTFLTGDDGWSFGGKVNPFDSPGTMVIDGKIWLSPESSTNCFSYWYSPSIKIADGNLYRTRWLVGTDVSNPDECVQFRLRINQTGSWQSWDRIITSNNQQSPDSINPKWYDLYSNPEVTSSSDNSCITSFDIMSFDLANDLDSWLFLDEMIMESVEITTKTTTAVYEFNEDVNGWQFQGEIPPYSAPLTCVANGSLGMNPDESTNCFSYWYSPDIALTNGILYKACYEIASSAEEPDDTVSFRLRVNQKGSWQGWERIVNSNNNQAPENGKTKQFAVFITPMVKDTSDSQAVITFDITSFDSSDDVTSWIYLDRMVLETFEIDR